MKGCKRWARYIDLPAEVWEIEQALKNIRWILISFFAHLGLALLVILTSKETSPPYTEGIVDLTLSFPAGSPRGSPTMQRHRPKASQPTPASEVPVVSGQSPDARKYDEDSSVIGNIPGDGPVGWGEVTRFPKVSREIKATYPAEAKKAGIEGAVVLEILVDATGKVRDVKIVSGPGYGLNESALEAIRKFEFLPAQKGAIPVPVKLRYTYRFKLDVN